MSFWQYLGAPEGDGGLLGDPRAYAAAQGLAGLTGTFGGLAAAFAPTTDPGARARALAAIGPMSQNAMAGVRQGAMQDAQTARQTAADKAFSDLARNGNIPEHLRPLLPAMDRSAATALIGQSLRDRQQTQEARDFIGGMGGGTASPAPAQPPTMAAGGNATSVPPNLMPFFEEASRETGIPVPLLVAQARQESNFNPSARGQAGEIGVMQIKPSTAQMPGFGVQPADPASLSDPRTNIMFGARYLAGRAGRGDWNDAGFVDRALGSYNGGGDPNYAANVRRWMQPQGGDVTSVAGQQSGGQAQPGGVTPQQIAMAAASGNPMLQRWATTMAPFVRQQVRADDQPETAYGTVQWGMRGDQPVMMVPTNRGNVRELQPPAGIMLTPPTTQVNTGTTVDFRNQRTGQAVTSVPINTRQREAEQALGTAQGQAAAAAPAVIPQTEYAMSLVDGLRNHRALTASTGLTGPILSALPGTPMYDFRQRVGQLQGQNFLAAFEALRGGGQISNAEGEKATQAVARLNQGLSERDFRQALDELTGILRTGLQRSQQAQARGELRQPRAPDAAGVGPEAPIGNSGMTATPPNGAGWSIQRVQ